MLSREGQVEPADKWNGVLGRTAKMARVGRKYVAIFELASSPGTETGMVVPGEWASRVLRLMASASWADPVFLEELSDSGLVQAICQVHPILKAGAANRALANSIQDLADLEEAMRKLRHELALAEKRLPSHGNLGSGGSAFYTTWACVGHVCSLMLQALMYSNSNAIGNPSSRSSPPPAEAARDSSATAPTHASMAPPTSTGTGNATQAASGAAGTPAPTNQASGSEVPADRANSANGPTPPDAAPTTAAPSSTEPGRSGDQDGGMTPRGHGHGSVAKALSGAFASPGAAGSGGMPALASETALLKLIGNKHVLPRAKEVLRVVPEPYQAVLARVVLTQITSEMKATHSGLSHILQILRGDPAATTPAPSSLPKAYFSTAALLSAYREALTARAVPAAATSSLAPPTAVVVASSAPVGESETPPGPTAVASSPPPPAGGEPEAEAAVAEANGNAAPQHATTDGGASTSPAPTTEAQLAATAEAADGNGDVQMAEADAPPPPQQPAMPAPVGADSSLGASPPSPPLPPPSATPSHGDLSTAAAHPSTATASAVSPSAPLVSQQDDPRVALGQLLEDLSTLLLEAVTGAHGVGRMALLLRGEAAAKFPSAASFMPTALSINELVSHLDALACVGAAVGAEDRVRPAIAALLSGPAVRELLGVGKVYVTTVIGAGALTRDLGIEAVIPQSLRQGYMAAVMTPLETGALLNERRAPQVLAYRNNITESSYYQVMDADTLAYGVNVRFEDEQEAEGMGVVREWLSQIAADLFSPERGLFVRGAADRRIVHPAPQSSAQEDFLGYMRFAGRIVGLALRANVPLGVVLSSGLFKYLTGCRANMQDLQQVDPQLYTTCQNILSTPGAESLELFHVWHRHGPTGRTPGATSNGSSSGAGRHGAPAEVEVELLPGGSTLPVTDANKAAYVELLAHHVVVEAVEEQSAAFLAGLQDTAVHLPEEPRLRRAFLTPLLLEDLNRITAGESRLEPEDWAAHTDVAGFEAGEEQSCVDLFWKLVAEYGPEDRQRLLQFWTAMTHLPSGGFKALNQRLQIMKLGPSAASARQAAAAATVGAAGAAGTTEAAMRSPPPADTPGPRSHQLDGDGLEGEEQEPSTDGLEEAVMEEAAGPDPSSSARAQGRESGGDDAAAAAAATAGASMEPPPPPQQQQLEGGGHAAPAAEADLSGAAAAAANAAHAGNGIAGASASQGTGNLSSADGDSGDVGGAPYGEEEYGDDEDDDMDYGAEDEEADDDEEFQRQLEMALALSLQDIPPEQPPSGPQGPYGAPTGAGAGAGAGGSAAGGGSRQPGSSGGGSGGAAAEGSDGSAGAGALSGGVGDAEATTAVTAAAARGSEGAGGVGGDGVAAAANAPPAGMDVAEAEAATPAAVDDTAAAAADSIRTEDAMATGVDEHAATAPAHNSGEEAPGAAAAAAEPAAAMHGGEDTLMAGPVGEASTSQVGSEAADSGQGAVSNAAGDAGASGPAAAIAPAVVGTEGAGVVASAPPTGSESVHNEEEPMNAEAPPEPMDTEAEGADGAAPAGNGVSSSQGAASEAAAQAEAGHASGGLGLPPAEEMTEAAAEAQLEESQQQETAQQQQHDTEEPSEGRSAEQYDQQQVAREQPGQQQQETGGAGAMDAEGAGGAVQPPGQDAAAAAAAPGSTAAAGRVPPPLLPQSRTCFLQLNLPVYGSLEDMRRAFAVALDNMSFGLH